MNQFSADQANRMRCTLESFRYELIDTSGGSVPGQVSNPSPTDGATGVSASTSLGWGAANDGANISVAEFEPVFDVTRGREICESGRVHRLDEEVTRTVTGKHPARAIGAVRTGCQSEHEYSCPAVSKT